MWKWQGSYELGNNFRSTPTMIKSLAFGFLALFLFSTLTQAQQQIDLEWSALDSTVKTSPNEFRLIADSQQQGQLLTEKPLCAASYRVSFDAFFGSHSASDAGGKILFFELDRSNGINYILNQIKFDTDFTEEFPHWGGKTNDPEWELEQNHISFLVRDFDKQGESRYGMYGESSLVQGGAQSVSFNMENGTWHQVEIVNNAGELSASILNETSGTILRTSKGYYRSGLPTHFKIIGYQDASTWQEHRVRNIQVEILEDDDCGQFSNDQANENIFSVCGADDCSTYTSFISCAVQQLSSLKEEQQITSKTYDDLLSVYENKSTYCDAQEQCPDRSEEIEALKQQIVEFEVSLDKTNSDLSAKDKEIVDLKSHINVLNTKLTDLQSKLDKATEEITSLKVQIVELQSKLDSANGEKSELEQKFSDLNHKMSDAEQAHNQAISDLEAKHQTDLERAYKTGYEEGSASCKDDSDDKNKKIEICHVPPGNPENAHTLKISLNSIGAHLAHSTDYLGPCIEEKSSQKEQSKAKQKKKKKNKRSRR